FMQAQLDKRKPKGKISTQRKEADDFIITSGVFNGYSTGTPIHIMIENKSQRSSDYHPELPRPSHADYVAHVKYHGYEDYRGGGHFSGRLTAPIVACGSIALDILKRKGILIGTHIKQCQHLVDRDFVDYEKDIALCNEKYFAVLDELIGEEMISTIETVAAKHDSVGGILESCILNLPIGVGEPYFHSIESQLSSYLFSIGAVKGIEFGLGFDFVNHLGSEVKDELEMKDGKVTTTTNYNGGINGGISNGMPILLKVIIKPTPSIFQPQKTVNLTTMTNDTLNLQGRHDPAIFHRARVVVDSMIALCILDLCVEKFGEDWLL
ncbi:MAG: chorismate synthase, partial [Traorella sp.]